MLLTNKDVLERFENILLGFANSTNDYNDYANKVEEFTNNMANKTGLYKELIYLWLDEKLKLKENDLKKVDDYFNIIENKKNCVNLLTAIAKGYINIKFDLDDEFTNGFVENLHKYAILDSVTDDKNKRLIRISKEIRNNEAIGIRDILFTMSYINVEEEYDYISKRLMIYKVEQDWNLNN